MAQIRKIMVNDIPGIQRSVLACTLKWGAINPSYSNEAWTDNDYDQLCIEYERYGTNWSKYQQLLPRRNPYSLRRKFERLCIQELLTSTCETLREVGYRSLVEARKQRNSPSVKIGDWFSMQRQTTLRRDQ